MKAAIKTRQQTNVAKATTSSTASTSGQSDAYSLVGFGQYKLMTRFDLFNSTQDEHKRYVESILECSVSHPGGQLDKLKTYFEKQVKSMQQEQLEDDLLIQAVNEVEQSEILSQHSVPSQ